MIYKTITINEPNLKKKRCNDNQKKINLSSWEKNHKVEFQDDN